MIVRALGGLGDMLVVAPALARFRHHLPDARLTLIGLPGARGAVSRFLPMVDRFVEFPGFPGVPEHPFEAGRLARFLDDARTQPRPDLAVQMHGSGGVTNVFTALLGAEHVAGYHVPGAWQPDARWCPAFPDHLSERDRWLALAAHLGFGEGDPAPVAATRSERRSLDALVTLPRRYAVVHPGASDPLRRWPAERFAAVADALVERGFAVILTGVEAERTTVASVAAAMRTQALDLTGQTDLGAMLALVERAALVVTNDTGTSHLAAATGTPSIVIFLESDPRRWAPADRERHRVVGQGRHDAIIGIGTRGPAAPMPPVSAVLAEVDALAALAA